MIGSSEKRGEVLRRLEHLGIARASDLLDVAGSTRYLADLTESGVVRRVSRGIYALPGRLQEHDYLNFAEVGVRRPKAVICLLSALQFHDLGTQLPPSTWVAIPTGSRAPSFPNLSVEFVRMSPKVLEYGAEPHTINTVQVRITSPVKTACDCFRFRSKVGTGVAIEALRDGLKGRRFSSDELYLCASATNIWSVIRPYAESVE